MIALRGIDEMSRAHYVVSRLLECHGRQLVELSVAKHGI